MEEVKEREVFSAKKEIQKGLSALKKVIYLITDSIEETIYPERFKYFSKSFLRRMKADHFGVVPGVEQLKIMLEKMDFPDGYEKGKSVLTFSAKNTIPTDTQKNIVISIKDNVIAMQSDDGEIYSTLNFGMEEGDERKFEKLFENFPGITPKNIPEKLNKKSLPHGGSFNFYNEKSFFAKVDNETTRVDFELDKEHLTKYDFLEEGGLPYEYLMEMIGQIILNQKAPEGYTPFFAKADYILKEKLIDPNKKVTAIFRYQQRSASRASSPCVIYQDGIEVFRINTLVFFKKTEELDLDKN